jgi:hypothetical protein
MMGSEQIHADYYFHGERLSEDGEERTDSRILARNRPDILFSDRWSTDCQLCVMVGLIGLSEAVLDMLRESGPHQRQ